ncbi:MAG TPA: TetR family transcriptional regulator [Candidatus Dormibacteraeota bacterium]|nr:TetR family transcriptional regulator [Candidatus Dormibacteraeota bacterium]
MGRPALHEASTLVRVAQELAAAASGDHVTIAAVAQAAGAPVGSIYHRFGSRDRLMAAAWLDALSSFQPGFIDQMRQPGDSPGLAAVLFTTAWAREHPVRSRVLVLRGAREFGQERWTEMERERARSLAGNLESALQQFCLQYLGGVSGEHRRLATFALLDLPYAALRRYLAVGIAPPAEIDRYLAVSLPALLPTARRG